MVKLGWLLTVYLCLSLGLFIAASFTINGAIIYIFILPQFYGAVLLWWWLRVWQNRTKVGNLKQWIWHIVLALQILAMLVSPGNCFGAKQGDRCYSNLQILVSDVSRTGPNLAPHWTFVEDAFPGLVLAYGVAIVVGLKNVSIVEK